MKLLYWAFMRTNSKNLTENSSTLNARPRASRFCLGNFKTMPFLFHLILFLLLPHPTLLLTHNAPVLPESHRISRDTDSQPIKLLISEPCLQADMSEARGKEVEVDLEPGSPLVLTHRIRLLPGGGSGSSPGCGACGVDMATLRERMERLEREVSELRQKCGGPDGGGCCTSQQSKGAGCTTVRPPVVECPDDCSDQGRCEDGKCVCFPGFSGEDCSISNCPGNCNDKGKCVNGQCVCDPGFTGPDCSQTACPGNCRNRGRCLNGRCVCDTGFSGPDCSLKVCPKNCSNRGRCINGKCVCEAGFTGPDCSLRSCPGNCNSNGRCVNGKCVCDSGFTGLDCSERSCPENCKNKGRCVNGVCVCNEGFSGPDCSVKTCPNNCHNRGRCVNGKCVCETGFTGPDCSEKSCPGNCNNKGQCVNGQCVCDAGFTGPDCSINVCPNNCNDRGTCVDGKCVCNPGFTSLDCSSKSCPSDCSNHGRCVDGQCICNDGFAGLDCATKTCPNNCSNRGRCVKGRCQCRRGFTGPDCSACEAGFTGPDCGTALTGVSDLSTRDITDSSVTLFWTPPAVQYDTYHITFTSKKESERQVTAKVSGSLSTYTQLGLASGQRYTATITGETQGKRGADSSVHFQTLISGPRELEVVKTSTTSVIVQWEQAQGEIDRYLLSVLPNQTDGSGTGVQEIRLPPERDSAQIDGLEPGRLYDLSLRAEKDGTRSLPASVQATSGTTPKHTPRVSPMESVTMLEKDSSDSKAYQKRPNGRNQGLREKLQKNSLDPQGPETSQDIRINTSQVNMSTQPAQSRPTVKLNDKVFARPGKRPDPIGRKPNIGMMRPNGTRTGLPWRGSGQVPPKKPTLRYPAEKTGARTPISGSGLRFPAAKNGTMALTVKSSSQKTSVDGTHLKMQPVGNIPKNGTETTESEEHQDSAKVLESFGSSFSETLLEPTVTTERNLTAYINGTKCVRKVLVGHRKIHKDGGSDGKTKNMTVVVSHINGNDIVRKILTGATEGLLFNNLKPLGKEEAKLQETDREVNILGTKEEEDGEASTLPMDHTTETFTKEPASVSTPKFGIETSLPLSYNSVYTSPTPSPKIPHSQPAMIPVTHDQLQNKGQLSRDENPPRNSSRLPLFSKRDPASPRLSNLSTSIIKGRRPMRPLSFVPPQIPKNRPKNKNNPSIPLSHPSSLEEDSKEKEVIFSQESHTDGSLTQSSQGITLAPLSTEFSVSGIEPDTTETNGGSEGLRLEHSNKEGRNEKEHSFRRTPVMGTFPRRPIRPFQNRTRPVPKPPQHSYRVHTHPRVINKDFVKAGQTLPHQSEEGPRTSNGRPNGSSPFLGPRFSLRRKNGTVARYSPKERGPGGNDHQEEDNESKIRASSVMDTSVAPLISLEEDKDVHVNPLSADEVAAKKNGTLQDVAENTVKDANTGTGNGRQSKPVQHADSVIVNTKPNVLIRRKNGSVIPPKLRTQIKPKSTSAAGAPETRKHQTTAEDSEGHALTEKDVSRSYNASLSVGSSAPRIDNVLPTAKNPNKSQSIHQPSTAENIDRVSNGSTFTDRRRNTTVAGIPKKLQARTHGSSVHTVPKTTKHSKDSNIDLSLDKDTSTKAVIPVIKDKSMGRTNGTFTISGSSEDGIDHFGVQNITSKGFVIIWAAPKGMFKNFIVTVREQRGERSGKAEEEPERSQEGSELRATMQESTNNSRKNDADKKLLTLTKVIPDSARSYPVSNLNPQTGYFVSLFGKGPGLRSNTHNFDVTTGPEPPSDLTFSEVTDNSLTVSWTRPKSRVSGFKVTHTHTQEGEPVSVMVDSADSALPLSKLSPGSSYEVSVISVLGLDESDPVKNFVTTLPDPPTDLRAINITDTKALLLWRPALATVDHYVILYGSDEVPGSETTIKVSGNAVEQQLQSLRASTQYSVTIISQVGEQQSSRTTTIFTTTSGSGAREEGPRDLTASQVTPRTALLSWKPPALAVSSYRLTYTTEAGEMKVLTLGPGITEYKVSGLHPSTLYTAQLQCERGGLHTAAISTEFTTGSLRFPFPTDCSQEMLNRVQASGEVEIFPNGKDNKAVRVYCDMETEGGGWTVFQRRKDGKVNFFRSWKDYSNGFGKLDGEFWLGNELLHNLTMMTPMTLRVDLRSGDESVYAQYSTFSVGTARKHYALQVSGYSGTAGDSMKYHDRRPFSTRDRDPQPFITRCAMSYRGGWWYRNCHEANLNGLYNTHTNHQGVIWTAWKGQNFSIPFVEMKIRPSSFSPHSHG